MKEWVVISCFKDNKKTAGFGSQVERISQALLLCSLHPDGFQAASFFVFCLSLWSTKSLHALHTESACSNVFWSYTYLTCRQLSYGLSWLSSFVKAIGNSANKFKRIPSVANTYKFFLPAHPLLKELLPRASTCLLNMRLHPSSHPSNFPKNK